MSLDKVREYLKAEPFNSVYYDGEYKKPCEAPAPLPLWQAAAGRARADVPGKGCDKVKAG